MDQVKALQAYTHLAACDCGSSNIISCDELWPLIRVVDLVKPALSGCKGHAISIGVFTLDGRVKLRDSM